MSTFGDRGERREIDPSLRISGSYVIKSTRPSSSNPESTIKDNDDVMESGVKRVVEDRDVSMTREKSKDSAAAQLAEENRLGLKDQSSAVGESHSSD